MGVNVEGKSRIERNRENSRRAVKILVMGLVASLVFSISFIVVYSKTVLNIDTIYEGVNINGDDIDGLSKEQAMALLVDRHDDKLKNKTLLLSYGDYSREVRYEEIGMEYDYAEKVDMAYAVGREGNSAERVIGVINAKKNGKSFEFEKKFEEELVDTLVSEVASAVNISAKDATISYEGGNFNVSPEARGLEVKAEELKEIIVHSIGERDSIEIPVQVDEPRIKATMLNQIQRLLGSYETRFAASQTNRNYNIRLSADSMDHRIVMPGEVFSFNESTGPRSTANGYKSSTVIINNEFVPGVGGGVCQTSTTLYNAIIEAQLDVVERHPHSLPVSYVPRGRDATVAYEILDFKFKNSFEFPIFIKTEVGESSIKIKIYGK